MKKLAASLAAGIMIAGASVSTATASEYTVEKGDNLWDIAMEYNTTVDKLVAENELKTSTIHPKQTLVIQDTYTVEKGDTLIGISQEYDVSVEELKDWNNLNSDLIVIGQALDIKDADIEKGKVAAASSEDTANQSDQSSPSAEPAQTTADAKEKTSQKQTSSDNPDGRTLTVTATAYTADCTGCSGVTSTGVDLNANPNKKVIAVDPDVIPLGSEVYVEGYGRATAADVGGAINGSKIDVHVPTKSEAYDWGVRTVDVTIVN